MVGKNDLLLMDVGGCRVITHKRSLGHCFFDSSTVDNDIVAQLFDCEHARGNISNI